MCYFITLGIDQKHAPLLAQRIRGAFRLDQSVNRSILQHLGPMDAALNITTGICSCALYAQPRNLDREIEKLRRRYSKPKYRKRGWSEEKIERAVADRLARPGAGFTGLRPDVRQVLGGVVAETGRLLIIVHWYTGLIDTENVSLRAKKIVTGRELLKEDTAVEEDTLVEVMDSFSTLPSI